MTYELRLAARVTAQGIRIANQQREIDELQVDQSHLRERLILLEQHVASLTDRLNRRGRTIERLRSRVQHARASRDMWRHRAMVR